MYICIYPPTLGVRACRTFFNCSKAPSFLSFFLPFFISSFLPKLPPYPPPGHQPESIFHTRTSSEPTFVNANCRIDVHNILATLSQHKAPKVDTESRESQS